MVWPCFLLLRYRPDTTLSILRSSSLLYVLDTPLSLFFHDVHVSSATVPFFGPSVYCSAVCAFVSFAVLHSVQCVTYLNHCSHFLSSAVLPLTDSHAPLLQPLFPTILEHSVCIAPSCFPSTCNVPTSLRSTSDILPVCLFSQLASNACRPSPAPAPVSISSPCCLGTFHG